jgi:hypothetical protein
MNADRRLRRRCRNRSADDDDVSKVQRIFDKGLSRELSSTFRRDSRPSPDVVAVLNDDTRWISLMVAFVAEIRSRYERLASFARLRMFSTGFSLFSCLRFSPA